MDPNGNPSFFTVYSASHNTCGASSYALNSTENMNKGGGEEGKNIPSPALAIFLENPDPAQIRNHYFYFLVQKKHNINASGSKIYTNLKKIKFCICLSENTSALSSNQTHPLPNNSLGTPLRF